MTDDTISRLCQAGDSKIVFLIADGLGGIPKVRGGTELETAHTPNLDRLVSGNAAGLLLPAGPGITCGSGPAHLALFGNDPLRIEIGRGVLAALGIGFELGPDDVAARGNFCTVDGDGVVTDRRAGRIASEQAARLVDKLQRITLDGSDGIELFVRPIKEHRFLLVLRGEGLGPAVADTDPQAEGQRPRPPRALDDTSARSAEAVRLFIERAAELLDADAPANMVLLRGLDRRPALRSMEERYGLRACAAAGYPMYRGLARLLGMRVLDSGPSLEQEIAAVARHWEEHDFFFVHYKAPDAAGEDGDFDAKVEAIEELDRCLPRLLELGPDVLVVTGDHSTPSQLRSHSWHPVPVVLAAETARRDPVIVFGETACAGGGLGQIPSTALMPLALAHAGRLRKLGA